MARRSKLVTTTEDGPRLFLVALLFNGVRFLALGVAIGYLNDRLLRADRHVEANA